MKLSEAQVENIRQVLKASGISHDRLRDDVLDHLCCVMEVKLSKEHDFSEALLEAIRELAPDGLQKIQRETVFLLNSKKIILMKSIMYFIGFVGALALTAATLFRILRWPGSTELFAGGYIVLLLIFFPLLAFDMYKVVLARAAYERIKFALGISSAVIGGTTFLMKVMHLQGADIMLLLSALVFGLGFLPFLFFSLYKKSVS